MIRYLDRKGNSFILSYSIEEDSITVQFKDGGTYLYNYDSTGVKEVEQMKRLAEKGSGLNTYINQFVRKKYARKLS